jgi:hypothetical protein
MNSIRKTAIVLGAIYIIALSAAMLRSVLLDSILDAPGYLVNLSSNEVDVLLGVILLFIMGVAIPSIGIVFYPILSKQNKTLALGYVVAGIIECVLFLITVIAVLTLLSLSKNYVNAGAPDNSHFQSSGILLIAVRDWAFNILWPISIGLATLILYYLLYQSELIPRWFSIWGLFGGVAASAGGLLSYFGAIGTLSIIYNVLLLQIAIQELVMAIWLIAKGFNPSAILTDSAKS